MHTRFVVALLLVTSFATAQSTKEADVMSFEVIPPGPEAAALGNFIDVPVGLYTGKPQLSIPIATVKSYSLDVEVSLHYNFGGLRVDDVASYVGAGWSLSAGGSISRSIRGKPDESGYGYFSEATQELFTENGPFDGNTLQSDNSTEDQERINLFLAGEYDLQPDSWSFNFGNYSGKIVFTHDKEPIFIPRQNLKVLSHPFNGNTWVIADEHGKIYSFELTGTTMIEGCSLNDGDVLPNTWQLAKITSASGLDEINFEYETETVKYRQLSSLIHREVISKTGDITTKTAPSICYWDYTVTEEKLSKITTKNGYTIELKRDLANGRYDLEGGHRLKSVEVKFNGDFVKGVELFHTYNGTTSSYSRNYLMLQQVREYNESGEYASLGHTFEYYSGTFPGRTSYSQDHWGFYNGKSNTTLVPAILNDTWDLEGADREPDVSFTKVGSLKKVIYPTQGYTDFEYELNTYSNTEFSYKRIPVEYTAQVTGSSSGVVTDTETFTLSSATIVTINSQQPCQDQALDCFSSFKRNGSNFSISGYKTSGNRYNLPAGTYTISVTLGAEDNYVYNGQTAFIKVKFETKEAISESAGGGLRVKKMTFHDGQKVAFVRTYEYTQDSGISSGKIMSYPKYDYTFTEENAHLDGLICVLSGSWTYLTRSASSSVVLNMTKGSYVGYDQVATYTESQEGSRAAGKTISKFSNYLGASTYGYPFIYPVSFDYKNGLVLEQTDYVVDDHAYHAVRIKTNNYTFSNSYSIHGAQVAATKSNSCPGYYQAGYLTYTSSYDATEAVTLSSTIQELITDQGSVFSKQYFRYDPDTYLITKSFTSGSDGKIKYTLLKYPKDFASGTMTSALLSRNISAAVVEKEEWLCVNSAIGESSVADALYTVNPADYRLTKSLYNVYSDIGLPTGQYLLTAAAPLDASAVTPSLGNYVPEDPAYRQENSILSYDGKGNIQSFLTRQSGYVTSFIWGYNDALPVARIENASRDEVYIQDFEFYTSAVVDKSGAHTGDRYWNSGTFTFDFAPPAGKTYRMDYWYFDGEKWIANVGVPFNTSIVTAGSRLDNIRVYPQDASITSYTYQPGWGLSSLLDSNGQTQYFSFDTFGRLSTVRDNDHNIVKQILYNYID